MTSPIKALSNQRYRGNSWEGYKVALETGDVKTLERLWLFVLYTRDLYK